MVPSAELRCTEGGGSQDFDFGRVDIDVLVKCANGAVAQTVDYLSPELRGMLRTGNVNLRVISMAMLLKALEQMEPTREKECREG